MIKHIKRLLVLLVLLAAVVRAPLAHAEGGLVLRPYWTFRTEMPVNHVQAGDINGDGVPEVVMVTADNSVYVLENGGDLAWRYETESADVFTVTDLEDDGGAEEIIVAGEGTSTLLRDTEKPACVFRAWTRSFSNYVVSTIDLDGDGTRELLLGDGTGMLVSDAECRVGKKGRIGPMVGQPVTDIWIGDVNGDGRPEIVPTIAGGGDVYVIENTYSDRLAWQQRIEGEVGLIQGGDVDGDGQAEVVVLGAAWDLFLLGSNGGQVWHNRALLADKPSDSPVPGQLIVHDLDGDGQMEIVVMAPAPAAAVHVFDGDGSQVWQHPLDAISTATRLAVGDVNDDGEAEVVVTTVGQVQVYLLDANGQRLAEYHPEKTTGALDYADLNGDGWGEVIVGTETGVQVFGTSSQVVRRELWRSQRLVGITTALYLDDLDGDGRDEVVVGSDEGRVYVLADDGHSLWEVDLEAPVQTLSAGDVDGDGQRELAVGTLVGQPSSVAAGERGQVHLLDGGQRVWTVSLRRYGSSVAVRDLDGDDRAEILVGSGLGFRGTVLLLDGEGGLTWQREFDQQVMAVGGDGGQVLVGTKSGRVYRLTADGSSVREYELGARVLSFDEGLAATADGRVYQLGDGAPTVVRQLGEAPSKVRVSGESVVMLERGQASLVTGDGATWSGPLESKAVSIAVGDLNGDGQAEMAVGTDRGRVHLFGLALDQPPLLTEPDLAETQTGYAYSVDVNDPDGDAVTVSLEIWDPSAGKWQTQAAQSAQGQDRLTWDVPDPFDIWDSGQESRFRFIYDDGREQSTTKEIPGPLTIPTVPWYVYYGQRIGLGALILMIPALGLLFYRRQRAYRLSPVGQAESLLRQLRTRPNEALLRLHDLARDDPIRLAYMPGLASEASETAITDLSEGFHLILTRPEVVSEGLRAVRGAVKRLLDWTEGNGLPGQLTDLYELSLQALEANTVSRIVALRPRLSSIRETLTQPDSELAQVAEALANLNRVTQTLHKYQRVETVGDKTAYLAQAIESLSRLDRQFQARLLQPERNILTRIALNWLAVSTNALEDLQGRAQLEVSLRTRQLVSLEQATLSLELTNTGHSPASNITVTLLPAQGYTAKGDGMARLDILPAGRSVLVELPVSAAPSVDHFRAEFTVTFDDRERSNKTLAFADLVHLLRPAAEFRPIPNPYAPGTPLSAGSPIFFGRDDLFQFIAENMAGLVRQNILVLIGQRRMGKTSFLQQLPTRLGQDYLPVYLDGQALGIDPGMANFFHDLALAIVDGLADQGIGVAEPKPEQFQERPSGTFERTFLPAVFEAIGPRQLLLLFDEFEELEMRVASGKLEPTVFPFFRHLMQHGGDLGFIFVGTHRLEALSADYWSIFFNIALYKHITFLDEEAARELITEPTADHGLLYDDLAVDKMLRVTAGHPYFLQLTCHALVNHANRERRGYLTIQDVNDVLGEMVELGEAHFAFLWEQSSPPERLVLASLTRLLGQEPTVTAAQVAELLAERGITLQVRDVSEALRRLVERDIVREVAGQPPRYEHKVALVRLWVERYKALGGVIEEVE